ncbi:hypothetical protein Vadar_016032 [Vaccinium darrowii]|uniref:Uncharacterized protein n=1 Tax=Vaccinium darrowii TaxID=229202 RepID=A0ACB7ZKK6_9ERIC|nr:hypothetical protein Vadar_016032 [Vaccinium darrowii]
MYSTNYLSFLLLTILILDFANVCFCRIPIIGGKDLDLHWLFVEVASCGGIAKMQQSSVTTKQKSTAGWLAAFPVFEPHWQVCMVKGGDPLLYLIAFLCSGLLFEREKIHFSSHLGISGPRLINYHILSLFVK